MAGGNNIARMSPRQKMINLMYIVLTAMLVLNVSSDVLNGFRQVHKSLDRTNENVAARNDAQYSYLGSLYAANPEKAGEWHAKGKILRDATTAIYASIDSIKADIARRADGDDADFNNIRNREDLEAASVEMLNPVTQRGKALRKSVENYRAIVAPLITDSLRRQAVERLLSTEAESQPGVTGKPEWEENMFDNMPAVAAVTLLSKLQNDIRHAESEALSSLITSVDIGDVRVNELNAYVIPSSSVVMRGGRYSADIVLAAVDTTQRPAIFIGGNRLADDNGHLEIPALAAGQHSFSGHLEVPGADGTTRKMPFSSSYTVIEPMATISPTMMNVLYAGIDNPISISVPGVPTDAVRASISSGTLTRSAGGWTARVMKIGEEATISVSAMIDGTPRAMGSMTFRVRKLPDPSPYIAIKDAQGNTVRYRGSPKKISKADLLASRGLGAALDDDILDVAYTVQSFSTIFFDSMGNAMPERSDGASFSARQRERLRALRPGRSFFISDVKAKGPDGVTRDIPPMQVSLY